LRKKRKLHLCYANCTSKRQRRKLFVNLQLRCACLPPSLYGPDNGRPLLSTSRTFCVNLANPDVSQKLM